MLILLISLMSLIPLYGLIGLTSKWELFICATLYGLLVGALQSFSRVLYSQLIPSNQETLFFSLFALTDKGSSWIGPLIIAIFAQYGSVRIGFVFLAVLLLLSIPILHFVSEEKGKQDAINTSQN